MLKKDIVERGFSVDEDGRVLDEYGHEYRNEYGCCEFEEDICSQCGKKYYINEVSVEHSNEGCCSEYCYYMDYLSS